MNKEKKEEHKQHLKELEKQFYSSAKVLNIDDKYLKDFLKRKDDSILFRLGCILILSACPILHIVSLFGNIKTLYENK